MPPCLCTNAQATLIGSYLTLEHEKALESFEQVRHAAALCEKYFPLMSPKLSLESYLSATHETGSRDVYWLMMYKYSRLLIDLDKFFDSYVVEEKFEEAAAENGLEMVKRHTIVERWPLALKKDATQEDFALFLATGDGGLTRCCEWRRV